MGIATLVLAAAGVAAGVGSWYVTWLFGRRAEKRAIEARDIVWSPRAADGGFEFMHGGSAAARRVFVTLIVQGMASTGSTDSVAPGEWFAVHNDGYAEHVASSRAAHAEYNERLEAARLRKPTSSLFQAPSYVEIGMMEPIDMPVDVKAVIVWAYPSGTSDRQELSWKE